MKSPTNLTSAEPTPWNPHPNRVWPPKITLAQTTTTEISDFDVGLTHDPVAQRRAEMFVRAALAYRMRQQERAEIAAARSTLIASSHRTLIRIASPADDADDIGMVPDAFEAVAVGRFQ